MNQPFWVSIIINNYNYGRFLAAAIESALAQSYPWTEVLVVDDGSIDNSPAVIASFGERIIPIFKENGGQASALNAGFAHCQGNAVIFLDADDTLHPTLVERVATLFQHDAGVVRVQYRLEMIDATGALTGECKPPRSVAIPNGDLRRQLLLYGDDIPWLPTSGNAFSAKMLQRIFPIPEAAYRICADYYTSNLSPLFGLVLALEETGGYYRVHGSNNHEKAQLDLHQTRQLIVRTDQTHKYMQEKAEQLGLAGLAANGVSALSLTFLANRLISRRLDASQHPIARDTRIHLARRGLLAAWQRPDLSLVMRLIYSAWFLLAALAPKGAARWLAEQFFYPETRGQWLSGALTTLRRARPAHSI